MKCKTVHRKLIFFLENELSVSEMRQVQEHLDVCSECALFAEDMKKTLSVLENDKVTDENPFFFTRVKARMEAQTEELPEKSPVMVRIVQPVAFSVILLVGIYAGFKLGQPAETELAGSDLKESQMVMYLNEMDAEPIEAFLME